MEYEKIDANNLKITQTVIRDISKEKLLAQKQMAEHAITQNQAIIKEIDAMLEVLK